MSDSVATGREQRMLEIIETARAKRARFRERQITLAHGAGGKASQTLIEGLFVPAFAGGGRRRWPPWRMPGRSAQTGHRWR